MTRKAFFLRSHGLSHCVLAAAVVGLLATVSARAHAQGPIVYPGYVPPLELREYPGNIRCGPVRIYSGLALSEEYTDNAFLTANNEKEDFLSIFSPSLALQLPMRRHELQLEYRIDVIRRGTYERYDTEDHYAQALANLRFGRGLTLKLGDTFLRTATPPDFLGDTLDEFNFNASTVQATYEFGTRYRLQADYTYSVKDYDRSAAEIDNFREHAASTTLYYRFLPKTWALVEYYFSRVDNNDKGGPSTDNDNHRVWAGLSWEPTAKIRGTAKGGYIERDYDRGISSRDSFGMQAAVQYSLTNRTTFDLSASREIIQTEFTREEQFYGVDYYRTGGTLVLRQKMASKIYGVAEGSFFTDDYNSKGVIGKKREDDRVSVGLGLEYHLRNSMALIFKYLYIDNDSNVASEDYTENQAFVSLSLAF